MDFNIVINWGIVAALTPVIGFVFNQLLKWLGVELDEKGKKLVVFGVAAVLAVIFGAQSLPMLPDFFENPAGFLVIAGGYALSVFKAAQEIYDRFLKDVFAA